MGDTKTIPILDMANGFAFLTEMQKRNIDNYYVTSNELNNQNKGHPAMVNTSMFFVLTAFDDNNKVIVRYRRLIDQFQLIGNQVINTKITDEPHLILTEYAKLFREKFDKIFADFCGYEEYNNFPFLENFNYGEFKLN